MRISYDFVKYTVWALISAVGLSTMLMSASMAGGGLNGSALFIVGTCPWVFALGYSLGKLVIMLRRPRREPTHEETIDRAIRIVRKRDGK